MSAASKLARFLENADDCELEFACASVEGDAVVSLQSQFLADYENLGDYADRIDAALVSLLTGNRDTALDTLDSLVREARDAYVAERLEQECIAMLERNARQCDEDQADSRHD